MQGDRQSSIAGDSAWGCTRCMCRQGSWHYSALRDGRCFRAATSGGHQGTELKWHGMALSCQASKCIYFAIWFGRGSQGCTAVKPPAPCSTGVMQLRLSSRTASTNYLACLFAGDFGTVKVLWQVNKKAAVVAIQAPLWRRHRVQHQHALIALWAGRHLHSRAITATADRWQHAAHQQPAMQIWKAPIQSTRAQQTHMRQCTPCHSCKRTDLTPCLSMLCLHTG